VILTYGCYTNSRQPAILSDEHQETGFFTLADVEGLNMPAGYMRSIRSWLARL